MCAKSVICKIKDDILGLKGNFIKYINGIKEISLYEEKNYWESVQNNCVEIKEINEKNIEDILSGLIYGLKDKKRKKEELENFSEKIFSKWYGDKKFLKKIKENIQNEKNKGIKDKLENLENLIFGKKHEKTLENLNYYLPLISELNNFEKLKEDEKLYFINKNINNKDNKNYINKKYPALIDIYSFNHETIRALSKICAKREDKKEVEIKHLSKICNLIYVKNELSYKYLEINEITKLINELNTDKYPLNKDDKIEIEYLQCNDIVFEMDSNKLVDLIDKLFKSFNPEIQFLTFEKEGNKTFFDVLKEKEEQLRAFEIDPIINKGYAPLLLAAKAEAINRIKNSEKAIEKILIEDLENAYKYIKVLDTDIFKKLGIEENMTNKSEIDKQQILDAKLYKKLDNAEDVREKIKIIQDKKDEKIFKINFQE